MTALADAMARVERVMNDRSGFHVDELDAETRADLLDAIVDAAGGPDLDEMDRLRDETKRLAAEVDTLKANAEQDRVAGLEAIAQMDAQLEQARSLLRRAHYAGLLARDLVSDIAMAMAGTPPAARQPAPVPHCTPPRLTHEADVTVRQATPTERAMADAVRDWVTAEVQAHGRLTGSLHVTTAEGDVVIKLERP